MRHILRISLAHFGQHRLRTALTLVGIAAGVMAIVSTTILSDSIFYSFENLVSATAGDAELHVANAGVGVPDALVEELRTVDGVEAVSAVVEGFVPLAGSPGKLLAIFGLDVLAEDGWRRRITRQAIDVPDEVAFVSSPDSILLTTGYAASHGLRIGSTLDVISPSGGKTLVVRGLVEHEGLAELFEGRVAVMDLPAAQLLLSKADRVDRIDLYLADGAEPAAVADTVDRILAGRGRVRDREAHGRRALDLLLTIRVMLGQAVVMSLIVGFLIIYHTMSVSIIQRHREIGLLRSLGASRRLLLGWVGLEAVFLGLIASTFGVIAAVGLGRFAVRLFGPVTDSWIRLSPIPPTVSWSTALTAVVLGAATSLAATVWAGAKVLRHPIQPDRNLGEVATSLQTRLWRVLLGAGVAGLFFGVLTALPPRLASFSWIMAYTAVDLVLLFAAFGLASALPALWMGRAGVAAAKPRRGVGLLFAASTLSRSPTAPAAVVTAIVVAFAWTVGNAAYMASVRKTWLGWVDREYPPGRILVTTPEGIAGLKPPTFVSSVLGEIHSVPGVARVEGMRQTEAQFAGRPIVLQARDEPLGGFHLSGADWQDVAEGFRNGRGVFLDDNLARTTGMAVGDVAILESVDGPQRFLVLALLDLNVEGGDLGSIVIARDVYQRLWHDSTISRVRVTVEDGFDLADVAEQLNERLAVRYGLHATTWRQYRVVFAELINSAFAGTYALIFVGFAVSFIAIVNFLLAMLVERRVWYQRLHILSAASSQIRGTIVAEGAILGVVGSLIGIAAAVAVSLVVVFRVIPMVNGWRFDYTFPIGPVVFGFVGTVLLAVAAAAFPARLATRSGYLLGAIEE